MSQPLDILKLTERAVELASRDEKLREKTKDTVETIVMVVKNGEDTPLTISVDRGELRFSQGAVEGPDFQFEISKEDFQAHDREGRADDPDDHPQVEDDQGRMGKINKVAGALGFIPKKKRDSGKRGSAGVNGR